MTDKTEAPTPRRLEDARAEGRVARSLELNTAAILLAGALLLRTLGGGLVGGLKDMIVHAIAALPDAVMTELWLRQWTIEQTLRLGPSLLTILLLLLLVGMSVTLGQTNFLWAGKKIGFDLSRVNPLNGFKRIFSLQGMIELGRALLKLGLVGWVAYSFLRGRLQELLALSQLDLAAGLQQWVNLASSLAIRAGGAYLALAVADYAYQRWRFLRELRMTKQELKEEIKRSEGDPFLRGRIRSQQRRMARSRMMANVHKASVVITNPTHLAVAIEYDPQRMNAPRLLAKGAYLVAQRIVQIARESGVPVIQNVPLARAIYKTVQIDQEIPPELYVAMAEVLAYVYRLRGYVQRPAQA